jgi:hypothetical protein
MQWARWGLVCKRARNQTGPLPVLCRLLARPALHTATPAARPHTQYLSTQLSPMLLLSFGFFNWLVRPPLQHLQPSSHCLLFTQHSLGPLTWSVAWAQSVKCVSTHNTSIFPIPLRAPSGSSESTLPHQILLLQGDICTPVMPYSFTHTTSYVSRSLTYIAFL